MAISPHETMSEKALDFRAPPPSPIASGHRSSIANDETLSDFLQHSLRVPDLILPDKVFPTQRFIQDPPRIDFASLDYYSRGGDTVQKIMDYVSATGCFELTNHGIPIEFMKSVLAEAAGAFSVPPDKRKAVMRSPEKSYGYDEESEEFVWCRSESLKSEMDAIWPAGYSEFSERVEGIMLEIEKAGERIVRFLEENMGGRGGTLRSSGREVCESVCYVRKRGVEGCRSHEAIQMMIRGFDHSHALCFHLCSGSSEFHAYSKKGWVCFTPDSHALVVTIGDQVQARSGGRLRQAVGRPRYKEEKGEDQFCDVSMAFLYPWDRGRRKENTVTLLHQAMAFLVLALTCQFLAYVSGR